MSEKRGRCTARIPRADEPTWSNQCGAELVRAEDGPCEFVYAPPDEGTICGLWSKVCVQHRPDRFEGAHAYLGPLVCSADLAHVQEK